MTSYHMVFKNGYFGSINKCGGLPTHLPEIWPQIDGADLAFLFQLYCDGEKLNIPNTLCIQGYQLFENGDYNSDIVVIQLPLDAKENIQQVGLSCPVSPDYAGGDIEFEVVEEQDNYDLDDLNVDDFYRWTKMGVPCSKLLGWCEKEIIPSNCAFLGWLADEDPFVIGNGYNLCFFLTPEGKVIASYRAPCLSPVQLIKIKRTAETDWEPTPAAGRSIVRRWTMMAGAARPLRSTRAASVSG